VNSGAGLGRVSDTVGNPFNMRVVGAPFYSGDDTANQRKESSKDGNSGLESWRAMEIDPNNTRYLNSPTYLDSRHFYGPLGGSGCPFSLPGLLDEVQSTF
jgi:hypothetical protein